MTTRAALLQCTLQLLVLAPNGHAAMSALSPLSGGIAEVGFRGRQVSF